MTGRVDDRASRVIGETPEAVTLRPAPAKSQDKVFPDSCSANDIPAKAQSGPITRSNDRGFRSEAESSIGLPGERQSPFEPSRLPGSTARLSSAVGSAQGGVRTLDV